MNLISNENISEDGKSFLTGAATGFCTAFVLCPSDVLKCRAQLNRLKGDMKCISSHYIINSVL